jgi:CheY-like chemotaxis protein
MVPSRPGQDQPGDLPRLRILVAEDNPTNQMITRRMLEKMGHNVYVVDNGRQAVEAFDGHHFDIILMDMEMPEMDGTEAARAIRRHEASAGGGRVPILAVTGNTAESARAACAAAEMGSFLTKPFNRAELATALEAALSLKRD